MFWGRYDGDLAPKASKKLGGLSTAARGAANLERTIHAINQYTLSHVLNIPLILEIVITMYQMQTEPPLPML
jgi:hypothetical protein